MYLFNLHFYGTFELSRHQIIVSQSRPTDSEAALWTCRYTGPGKHNTVKSVFFYSLQVRRVTCSCFFSNRRHKHKDGSCVCSWCKLQGEPWQVLWTVPSHQHALYFQLWLRSDHIHMSAWIWTLPPDKTFIYVIYLCHIIIVGLVDNKNFDYGLDFKGNIHSLYLFLYLSTYILIIF